MFTETLFVTVKKQKKPRCPSTDKWINKIWYIYTMESPLPIKRNEVPIHATMWMNFECVIQ